MYRRPACIRTGAGGGQAQRERLPLLRASMLLNIAATGMVTDVAIALKHIMKTAAAKTMRR